MVLKEKKESGWQSDLKQTVPKRQARVRNQSSPNILVFTQGMTKDLGGREQESVKKCDK